MTINYHDPVNFDGLFDIQGKIFQAHNTINAARLTTIAQDVEDSYEQFKLITLPGIDLEDTFQGMPGIAKNIRRALDGPSNSLRTRTSNFLIQIIENDQQQPERSLRNALIYLIEQMIADAEDVDLNVIGLSLVATGGNTGDAQILFTELRGDGKVNEHIVAERVEFEVTSANGLTPEIRARGEQAQPNRLAEDWPKGSGSDLTLTPVTPAQSLLVNGDFEEFTYDNFPDSWVTETGVLGTDIQLSLPEIQTVIISGTPTGGFYQLEWNDGASNRPTEVLDFTATSALVQEELRKIPGLAGITVVQSGSSPNFTHTITFTNVAGAVSQLTSRSYLTGGTPNIAHATTQAGDANTFRGQALFFDSDGATLTSISQVITLSVDTVYFCHVWAKRVGAASAGVLRIALTDGIGGSVIVDGEGNNAEISITASALGTSAFESQFFAFRLVRTTIAPVYLNVAITTAITSTANIYLDDLTIFAATPLYTGGSFVGAAAGKTAPVVGDKWTLTSTNSRAGEVHEWYNRSFDLAGKDLLLPSAVSGTIPDSVIS